MLRRTQLRRSRRSGERSGEQRKQSKLPPPPADLAGRCPKCKLGVMIRLPLVSCTVTVAPGESFDVAAGPAKRCSNCGDLSLSKASMAKARGLAEQMQRAAVLTRDNWACVRCGATGVPLEVAHRVGLSRARNPGASKNARASMESVCVPCHRSEHLG